MSTTRERIVRNALVIFTVLVLTQVFLLYMQHRQIVGLMAVDCAGYRERQARVTLYDRLILAHRRNDTLPPDVREILVTAYTEQRTKVKAAADASRASC